MEKPTIAAKQPTEVTLKAGKTYAWCACGLSTKQPFCDGSHKNTPFEPLIFKSEEEKKVWLCMCKQTANPCYCDGTHNSL